MLATWLIDHLMCGIYVGLPNGPVNHGRTRVINVKSQLSRSLEPTTYRPQEGALKIGFISRSPHCNTVN